jgi:phenylpropionate dioxygenase-like ring-hydroxylating dioxygenase large terminal subunit
MSVTKKPSQASAHTDQVAENRRSLHPSALRERIPAGGLREYWYPVIEAKRVRKGKPTRITMLGEKLALFRGKNGNVVATSATCPHRGASLGHGKCHFPGTLSCPYHGWTFDQEGRCVAVLGEGPNSRIPGMPRARVRSYPTVVLKGIVFAWMGEGEPTDPHEDIPPQFFDDDYLVQSSATVWNCNWRPAFENLLDSHVFYVHRNSVHLMMLQTKNLFLMSKMGPRRPRPTIINRRGLTYPPGALGFLDAFTGGGSSKSQNDAPAPAEAAPGQVARQDIEFQDVYPALDGARWPKSTRRLAWHKFYDQLTALRPTVSPKRRVEIDPEWKDAHLPSTFQVGYPDHIYSRLTVPIDTERSRIFYVHATKPTSRLRRAWDIAYFEVFQNWMMNYNFSAQDARVVVNQSYDSPETFSATDIFPLTLRRMILENARDFQKTDSEGSNRPNDSSLRP